MSRAAYAYAAPRPAGGRALGPGAQPLRRAAPGRHRARAGVARRHRGRHRPVPCHGVPAGRRAGVRHSCIAELPPRTPVGAGRPAAGLVVSPSGPAGLGLEINVDYRRRLRRRPARRAALSRGHRRRPARALAGAGRGRHSPRSRRAALAAAAAEGLRVVAATVALPGLVDVAAGRLRLAPNLGWRNVDVVALLRRHERPRQPADRLRQRGEPGRDGRARHRRARPDVPAHLRRGRHRLGHRAGRCDLPGQPRVERGDRARDRALGRAAVLLRCAGVP